MVNNNNQRLLKRDTRSTIATNSPIEPQLRRRMIQLAKNAKSQRNEEGADVRALLVSAK